MYNIDTTHYFFFLTTMPISTYLVISKDSENLIPPNSDHYIKTENVNFCASTNSEHSDTYRYCRSS